MDGNGRWAQSQGLMRKSGHEKGAEVVRDITTFCSNSEIVSRLSLYAFSTENWKRPRLEVEFLMKLLDSWLKKELPIYIKNGVKLESIGDISRFSNSLQKTIRDVEEKTAHCTGLIQSLALNYGARDEITRALQKIQKQNIEVSESNITNALDCPQDIDLLIRTGGDRRLSNFMLWQASYAELFFSDTLWPDFNSRELATIIDKFLHVERRFGGLK